MFSFVYRIKDRETAELLVDSLESYRRMYEHLKWTPSRGPVLAVS
jgi:hypothetical protein